LLVVRRVEVFGGVLVLGRIAAANMPTFETEAQVYPDPTSMWGRWPLDPHSWTPRRCAATSRTSGRTAGRRWTAPSFV